MCCKTCNLCALFGRDKDDFKVPFDGSILDENHHNAEYLI